MTILTSQDLYLFNEGSHLRLYERLGAHPGTRDGVVSDYSSRGATSDPSTWPDLSAPGENITSSCRVYLPICATGLAPQNGPGRQVPAGRRSARSAGARRRARPPPR